MNYWIIKSEPDVYSWDKFVSEGKSVWDGVRNYQARNNLKAMQEGDLALFYHSNIGKEIVGIAQVSHVHYPDPTIPEDPRWVVCEFKPFKKLNKTITLAQLKADERFKTLSLIKNSRLSVLPISKEDFDLILELSA